MPGRGYSGVWSRHRVSCSGVKGRREEDEDEDDVRREGSEDGGRRTEDAEYLGEVIV